MTSIAILFTDGMFDSSLAITLDILRTARQVSTDIDCPDPVLLSIEEKPGTGAGLVAPNIQIMSAANRPDYFVMPGLGLADPDDLETFLASDSCRDLVAQVKNWHQQGTIITASCSATFILAETGILDHGAATTGWWLADIFRARYPYIELHSQRILTSGDGYLCAGAAMAQADLMLALTAQVFGQKTAERVARYLLIDQRHLQAQYMLSALLTHRHPDIAKAEQWIKSNLQSTITINALAQATGLGSRTLARRIKAATGFAPAHWIQHLRLERAVHLLRNSQDNIDQIAIQVGYQNASSLRRIMVKHMGKPPSAWRHPNLS